MLNDLLKKIDPKRLKKIKSFSIVIIPSGGGADIKSKHLSAGKVYGLLSVYSLIILFAGALIFNATPLGNVLFPHRSNLSASDKRMIDELSKKLIFLTKELETLKTTNQQLKDAIMLGDSTLIDSLSGKLDTNNNRQNNPFGGDLLAVIRKLFYPGAAKDSSQIFFSMPLNGFISRGFNPDNGHMGIDIVARTGSPVYAAASGYIVFADYTVRDGYMMIIAHSDGYITVYKHCSALLKSARDMVVEGEMIALSGNTGEITTGPHLHFEVWKDGKPIDPKTVLINY